MHRMVSAIWFVARVAWRTGPLALVFTFGEVISTVLRFAQPAMVGLMIDGLTSRSLERLSWGSAALIASLAIGGALEGFAVGQRVKLIEDIGYAFDLEVMTALSRIRHLDRLEQPRLSRAIAKVRERADSMGFCFNGLMSVLIQSAAPISSICVAMLVDPRLLLLILGGVPAVLVTRWVTKLENDADDSAQADASRAVAWAHLVSDGDAGAERKVFGLWGWYRKNLAAALGRRDSAFVRPADFDAVASAFADVFYIAFAGAVLFWILTTGGHMSAGAVAAALLVSLDLKGALGALRFALSGFGPSLRAAVALQEVRDAAAEPLAENDPVGSSAQPGNACIFEDVSYSYATATGPAVRSLDLRIERGTVIAIVGANGAGKTTLVEMLLGLRRPTAGRAAVPPAEQAMIGQQFGRYEFTIAEAVALDDLAALRPERLAAVEKSLQSASVGRFWDGQDDGVATQLGAAWPDGTDLSVGQWQAVAAARCLYVDRAEFVVLDEPTSALDPEAQEAVTARYMSAARQVAARGGIAVLVTHRMSMPRRADHILVLHEGRIVEAGSHDDLLAVNGHYARAYHAQVSGFMELASKMTAE